MEFNQEHLSSIYLLIYTYLERSFCPNIGALH
uniref:Uncharacterized protein n=1 Tax=Podoviridae sp. ctBev14 TaxID=2823556 RepID=A0A8S5LAY2_9CAUD|nr:MAG TPA: hypothetical protein [Podoviridae sp. ctBev14]